jgi:DNA-binding CsgD family transcriptional regulator
MPVTLPSRGTGAGLGRCGRRRRSPIEAALSRTIAGRALAETGEKDRAVAELQRAAAALDACGAVALPPKRGARAGKLGHRPLRRTRPGKANGAGIESLTGRELQVAGLVVDRKTNPQIAAELFLSQKTVETHLRNIFHKMGVTTRTALARAVERTDPRRARDRNKPGRHRGLPVVTASRMPETQSRDIPRGQHTRNG